AAIDFGRAVFQDLQLSGAARAGAQYALESQAPAAIEAVTKAASGLDPTLVTVNTKLFCECADGQAITCGNTCLDNGFNRTYVRVTAQAPVRALFDRNAVGLPTTLSAEATMRLQ
ncbi:MAG: hypothetical protein K2Q10_02255, partial [Rhodospirillales bacterium]|nr:hypothetical protein [Rhodospirillales bacterium]